MDQGCSQLVQGLPSTHEALDSIWEESLPKAAARGSVCFLNNSVTAAWGWWKNGVQGFPWNFKQRSRCQREVRSEDLPRGKPGLGSKERGQAVSLVTQKAARAKSPGSRAGGQVWSVAAGICWLLPTQHLKVISTCHTPRRTNREDEYCCFSATILTQATGRAEERGRQGRGSVEVRNLRAIVFSDEGSLWECISFASIWLKKSHRCVDFPYSA